MGWVESWLELGERIVEENLLGMANFPDLKLCILPSEIC